MICNLQHPLATSTVRNIVRYGLQDGDRINQAQRPQRDANMEAGQPKTPLKVRGKYWPSKAARQY